MNTPLREHYSSQVQLTLHADGQTVPLSKIGPGYVVPESPVELPRCRGQVVLRVDNNVRRWDVLLVHGAVPFEGRIEVKEEAIP